MAKKLSEKDMPDVLTVLLFSIEGGRVLMPDVLVAEIVDFQATTTDSDDVPTWYLGELEWRGLSIPLISMEALNNDSFFSQSKALKIIVLHGTNYRDKLPYWAFVSLETPKMLRVNASDLVKIEAGETGEMEAMQAELSGEPVIIPDVGKIESEIVGLLDK